LNLNVTLESGSIGIHVTPNKKAATTNLD